MLDHPQLEPFDGLIKPLHRLVFQGGIEALQTAGLLRDPHELNRVIAKGSSALRRFIRGCHYSWDLAQRSISVLLIEYELSACKLRESMRDSLRKRDKEQVGKDAKLLGVLKTRQLVLRRLVDAILYHLIKHENWIMRRLLLDYKIREIDPKTLRRTIEIATELNRSERLNFHLASDLTTGVHVGDLVRVNFTSNPPEWSLVELKEGRMNTLLGDVLEKSAGKIEEGNLDELRQQFGEKAVSQLRRMARQQERHRNVMEVIETDSGTDIMYNTRIELHPEAVEVDDYGETLRKMIERSAANGFDVSVIDGCLRLLAVNSETHEKLGQRGIAHTFYHLQFPAEECTLQRDDAAELDRLGGIFPFFDLVQLNLAAMWPPPIFLWPMPDSVHFDLLFGRIRIFAQLDYDRLFETARSKGIGMTWAAHRDLEKVGKMGQPIPGSPNARGVMANLIAKPDRHVILLIGFFSRMLLEFMSPSQFLSLVTEDLTKHVREI